MDIFYSMKPYICIGKFWYRRAICTICLLAGVFFIASGQIGLTTNSYRTLLPLGDWANPAIWQVFDGTAWIAAATPPDRNHDVFILQGHEVRLTQNQEIGNVYLFGDANAGKKLNLQDYDLDVYGSLHSFTVDGNGDYLLHGSTWLGDDWIYPETGRIVFKGSSRTVVDRASWSGQNLGSRFSVVFNPYPGEILVVNAVFKASDFLIQSGTVRQTVNTNGDPATSTFSFTATAVFGTEDFGELRIASGATLISEASKEFDQILRRTVSKPASLFVLEEGANLVLLGQEPVLDAVNLILDGNVYYSSDDVSQQFLQASLPASQENFVYTHLYLQGAATKLLPPQVSVKGDFTVLSGGAVVASGTDLDLIGPADQELEAPSLVLSGLLVDKEAGTVWINNDLTLRDRFEQVSGNLDFQQNDLLLDFGPTGTYTYSGGNWFNLGEFTYENLPLTLTASNARFPYYDQWLDAPRHFLLEGSLSAPGQGLVVRYLENPGVTYDPGFMDEGEAVVYHLNSFFSLSTAGGDYGQVVAWVSAEDLSVQDLQHLRLVGDGEAAIGQHVTAGEQQGWLWARRSFPFQTAQNSLFTVGSISPLSVLPLDWKGLTAQLQGDRVRLTWKTGSEASIAYTVTRSTGHILEFSPIGSFEAAQGAGEVRFEDDRYPADVPFWYYQIIAKEESGALSYSPVLRVDHPHFAGNGPKLFPNPHISGPVHLTLGSWSSEEIDAFSIWNLKGVGIDSQFFSGDFEPALVENRLLNLPIGNYLVQLTGRGKTFTFKWQKSSH